jgi:hypothetical protein
MKSRSLLKSGNLFIFYYKINKAFSIELSKSTFKGSVIIFFVYLFTKRRIFIIAS